MTHPTPRRGSYTAAAILILAGVLFLLNNMGWYPIGPFIHLYWPCILILIGVIQLAANRGSGTGGALFLILLGLFIQAIKLDWFSWNWHITWPAALILLGLWIILKPRREGGGDRGGRNEISAERIDSLSLFSGVEQTLHAEDFTGGEATAIFGGATYDLRGASTRRKEMHIAVTAIFGGIEILIPPGWRVVNRITPILGGVEEKRRPPLAPILPDAPVLVLTGAAIFGGVEIKD